MIEILKSMNISAASVVPFKSVEDGSEYNVWHIISDGAEYVLKKATGTELSVYSAFFSESVSGAPRLFASANVGGKDYFLMEYIKGNDMCKCDRRSLIKVLDALISLQNKYWGDTAHTSAGLSFSESLESRKRRGNYLNDRELEVAYSQFLAEYERLPRTLCHDDLLPFNVLISEGGATIIDWEVAGILPYPTSLARLIAHTEESENAMFYMTKADKLFAVDYYYENLVSHHGISYEEYRRTLDLFLLYEYCEWIMLGNKYEDASQEMFDKYTIKAKEHIKTMKESLYGIQKNIRYDTRGI